MSASQPQWERKSDSKVPAPTYRTARGCQSPARCYSNVSTAKALLGSPVYQDQAVSSGPAVLAAAYRPVHTPGANLVQSSIPTPNCLAADWSAAVFRHRVDSVAVAKYRAGSDVRDVLATTAAVERLVVWATALVHLPKCQAVALHHSVALVG